MKPLEYFGVTSQQVTTHAVHALKIEGQFMGNTADRWLQVHDSAVVPADTAVPMKQWVIPQASPFFQTFSAGELALTQGLYICISNTDGTKTLSGDTMDLGVELTDPEQPSGTSFVGGLVLAVASRQLWQDSAGPKKLFALEVDNTGGADSYIMLFATDTPANGDKPVAQYTLKANAVLTGVNALRFGTSGRDIQSIDTAGTLHKGCTVKISTTTGVLTGVGGTPVKIKGELK